MELKCFLRFCCCSHLFMHQSQIENDVILLRCQEQVTVPQCALRSWVIQRLRPGFRANVWNLTQRLIHIRYKTYATMSSYQNMHQIVTFSYRLHLATVCFFNARFPQVHVIKAAFLTWCQLSAGPRAQICDRTAVDPVGTNAMFLLAS